MLTSELFCDSGDRNHLTSTVPTFRDLDNSAAHWIREMKYSRKLTEALLHRTVLNAVRFTAVISSVVSGNTASLMSICPSVVLVAVDREMTCRGELATLKKALGVSKEMTRAIRNDKLLSSTKWLLRQQEIEMMIKISRRQEIVCEQLEARLRDLQRRGKRLAK